ncbi:calcium-binding protein, partial [Chromohalobacter israelensis]|uniref:calcium-binding protein n=1 Tax=Chromohalobacter israelensis TaxID=141390 RepID=UPI00265C15CC|nr:hypothetical protein [Chromohalobacter salexigens]
RLQGGLGDDRLDGDDGDDVLEGGAGNDTLYGGDGEDRIDGGAGNDTLNGGDGADRYMFSAGDGHDTINNFSQDDDLDTLYFEDIDFQALRFSREEDDLSITVTSQEDSVTVASWYADEAYSLDRIETEEGALEGDALLPLETLESGGAGTLGVNAAQELTLV